MASELAIRLDKIISEIHLSFSCAIQEALNFKQLGFSVKILSEQSSLDEKFEESSGEQKLEGYPGGQKFEGFSEEEKKLEG